MKISNLRLINTENAKIPSYHDQLIAWIDRLPAWFTSTATPRPKATLLCGLPGVGKGDATKVIARTLNRPLFRLDPWSHFSDAISQLTTKKTGCVLWVDRPGEFHFGLLRWLLDDSPDVLVVFTSDAPHRLPPGFTRADVVSSVWHLELPDLPQRNGLWGELLSAAIPGFHEHDSVKLGQLSPMFTPAEIRAAFEMAVRNSGGTPVPGALIDAVLAFRPLAPSMDEHLACLRAWSRVHALEAAAGSVRPEQ